jgi:histidinol dehydrogenase
VEAARRIEAFHRHQLPRSWWIRDEHGSLLGQQVTPLDRVGCYVPGGTAVYPSTVLMTLLPARVAGVRELVVVSPPGPDGRLDPSVLVAARLGGATEAYMVGGAQAVAALAYGTATIRRVDKIVGPGNVYVALAAAGSVRWDRHDRGAERGGRGRRRDERIRVTSRPTCSPRPSTTPRLGPSA